MKRTLVLALLLIPVGALAIKTPASSPHPRTLRVMTYNIHHGEGTDHEFDLVRLAEIIKRTDADLVALQEVDQATQRSQGVNQLTELARLTGLNAAFGKAMDFQGGGYGVGVLSKSAIRHVVNRPLPDPPGFEPRTALTVDIEVGTGGPLVHFTSTHLDSGRDFGNRVAQADHLNQLTASDDSPAILAGDLNCRTDSEPMEILRRRWVNASPPDFRPSDPAARWFGRVDHVLVRPAPTWRVIASHVIDAPAASDHLPVLAEIEIASENQNR